MTNENCSAVEDLEELPSRILEAGLVLAQISNALDSVLKMILKRKTTC